jgi:hypothetical protein
MKRECCRSAEVAAAVAGGERLDDGSGELELHVAGCTSCADVVLVMSSLRSEWDRLRRTAPVPSAGLVWWRAQLRQRQEAARAAAAPVTVLHGITLALTLGLAVFLVWTVVRAAGITDITLTMPPLPTWLSAPAPDDFGAPSVVRYGVILAATAWLILGPVALYFALRRD